MTNTAPRDLYQINLSYACGGIFVTDGHVVEAPPIFRWMVGKLFRDVEAWVVKRRGQITKENAK
jgi:hypothetical protein